MAERAAWYDPSWAQWAREIEEEYTAAEWAREVEADHARKRKASSIEVEAVQQSSAKVHKSEAEIKEEEQIEDERLQMALARAMLYSASAGLAASQPKAPAPVQLHFVQPSAPVPPPPPLPTTQELHGYGMRHGFGQQAGFVPATTQEQPGDDTARGFDLQGGFEQPATTQEQPGYDKHGFDLQGGFQQPVEQGGYAPERAGQQGDQGGYAANAGHVEPGGYVGQGGDAQQTGAPPEVEPAPVHVQEEEEPNGWTDNQGRYWSRDTHNPLLWWNLDPVDLLQLSMICVASRNAAFQELSHVAAVQTAKPLAAVDCSKTTLGLKNQTFVGLDLLSPDARIFRKFHTYRALKLRRVEAKLKGLPALHVAVKGIYQ
ncbi:hypothetical protein AK812_SmicGene44248 [Symbiodinium microadriaticum]|uniref:Uncharacterized protein n=1 Tax=Symbiodinium microadriaticum TaxID=2951 RepID=A0A1Q9BYY5_SYMMI|nr:hypothetical protein AK812_SmicGene44248 [Symbiodinium microadriaticum]CAE7637610.1 unnamed protein product [Symbiodinium microadriaticum]